MTARTVAEIIGAQKIRSIELTPGAVVEDFDGGRRVVVGREESEQGRPGWKTPAGWFADEWFDSGHLRHIVSAPTVDDLLSWLHPARAFIDSIEPETGLTPGAGPDDRWCVFLHKDDRDDYFTAPTLLAALEAAVRAVAGEDEQ